MIRLRRRVLQLGVVLRADGDRLVEDQPRGVLGKVILAGFGRGEVCNQWVALS